MEKRLRCKDCKCCGHPSDGWRCYSPGGPHIKVNPGQFACKKFVYKDK